MTPRKIYRPVNTENGVNLLRYEELILNTINSITPGKNPVVYTDYFEIDMLDQREAVALGRALSGLNELQQYGRRIESFRLFKGTAKGKDEQIHNHKGGHMHGNDKTISQHRRYSKRIPADQQEKDQGTGKTESERKSNRRQNVHQ